MWIWLLVALLIYHFIRWPWDLSWLLLILSVLQVAKFLAHVRNRSSELRRLSTLFRVAGGIGILILLHLYIFGWKDFWTILILSGTTLLYGGLCYYNEAEYHWESASTNFRRRKIWDLFYAFYDIRVSIEKQHVRPNNPLERAHRLLSVHYDRRLHYMRPPLDRDSYLTNARIFIAHPHGSHPLSLIYTFALYGTHALFKDATRASSVRLIIDPLYFAIPVVREVLLWGGCLAPDTSSIGQLLDHNLILVTAPGGYEESLLAASDQLGLNYGNETYFDALVSGAQARQFLVTPLVLLGENENITLFRFFDQFRQWLWRYTHVRLPGFTRIWPVGERHVLVGIPQHAVSMTNLSFYRHWLHLLDEGRSSVRQESKYFELDGTENENMRHLRRHFGLPLLLRDKIGTLYDYNTIQ